MRKHRAGTLAVITVSALALAACGRAEGGAGAAEGPGEAIEEGAASGTIEVWAMGHEGEILDDFSAAFEDANPDADVKVTAVPWEAAYSKISNAVAAGNTPDVALVGTTWMGEFAKAGGIAPMPEGLVDGDDFFEGAWNSTLVGGTAYGVPWYVETRVLFYRKDLAEKAGWSEAPQTWDDLKQFTVDLQEKAGVEHGIQLPAGGGGSWTTMMSFGWSNGGSLINEDGTEYTLDTPQTAEAMDYYTSFFEEGIAPAEALDDGELESGFADGTFGSFVSGPWHIGLVEEAGLSPDQYGMALLPGPDGPGASFVGGGDLAVFSDSDNQENAWKYVQWLAEPETQLAFYDEVGNLPAVRAAWEDGELADNEQLQIFGQQLDNAQSPPATPTWEQVAAVMDSGIERATRGNTPTEDALASMQQKAASIGTGL